uniref:DDE Tnp4 domain-containing protein n=1 Tax=Elaeophora elaphi TaxID=1147741 RepID=A0A0R3RFJ6_9BILA
MTCHSNRMDVHLEFVEPFDGIIFADQAYNDSACRWEVLFLDQMEAMLVASHCDR